jgi:hypothetical protein
LRQGSWRFSLGRLFIAAVQKSQAQKLGPARALKTTVAGDSLVSTPTWKRASATSRSSLFHRAMINAARLRPGKLVNRFNAKKVCHA